MGDKLSQEESFRLALRDIIAIAEKLTPFFTTTEELVGACKLAVESDGQLKLIMAQIKR